MLYLKKRISNNIHIFKTLEKSRFNTNKTAAQGAMSK